MKKILVLLGVLAGVSLAVGAVYFILQRSEAQSLNSSGVPIRIGLSLDSLREDRWKVEKGLMEQKAATLGASIVTLVAGGNDALQNTQIENLIAQKVDVLIVVPHSGEAVAPSIAKAHAAGIKVVAYDRLIKNSDLDMYVSFDNEKVGQLQAQGIIAQVNRGNFAYVGGSPTDNNAFLVKAGAMKVLEPYIKKGDIKLVFDQFTTDWSPNVAYKNFGGFLAKGTQVDAVVAANDGTAYGVILALTEKGLAGQIPVSGQDAELSALRRIKAGTQTTTVYKPLKLLADKAVEQAVTMATGKTAQVNSVVNNGKIDVPSYLITPILVTAKNMAETVIKDGFHTAEEINSK